MNRIKLVTLVLMLSSFSAEAGWFGPDNFDDCVLENMKGVSSDAAARAVVIVCRRKFPLPEPKQPTAEELAAKKAERQAAREKCLRDAKARFAAEDAAERNKERAKQNPTSTRWWETPATPPRANENPAQDALRLYNEMRKETRRDSELRSCNHL